MKALHLVEPFETGPDEPEAEPFDLFADPEPSVDLVQQQREAYARLANTLEATTDLVLLTNTQGEICYMNRAGRTSLKLNASDLDGGVSVRDLCCEDSAKRLFDEAWPRCMMGDAWEGRLVFNRQNYATFPTSVVVLAHPIATGETRFLSIIARDISGQQRIEEDLRTARDAARAMVETEKMFVANMSHELRTPLHAILSFARFGLKKMATVDRVKLQSYFERIETSGETLLSLVNDVLDLSKARAGECELGRTSRDLVTDIESVVEEMRTLAVDRGLAIELDAPSTPVVGRFDGRRMMQVTRNLLSNAIKFSEKGAVVHVRVEASAAWLRVSVIDSGVGIPPNELESIFIGFRQSSRTDLKAGGTGLGLAIAHENISLHGGRIWAENGPESGAIFRFEIPKCAPREALEGSQ